MAADCPRCDHSTEWHWSNQDPPLPTTACQICLNGQIVTVGSVVGPGICCTPASEIKEGD